jgi:hypothetical protein
LDLRSDVFHVDPSIREKARWGERGRVRFLPVVILGTIVLFLTGLVIPRKSKRVERWVDQRMKGGRRKADRKGGRLGDWTAKSLWYGQRLADGALVAGRSVRGWLPF